MKRIFREEWFIFLAAFLMLLFLATCNRAKDSSSMNSNLIITSLQKNLIHVVGGKYSSSKGSDISEADQREGELQDFYLSKFELTQKEWRAVMGADPPKLRNKGLDDNPVEMVTWDEVNEFIVKLNEMTGLRYRLPTNIEWEYAARGGQKSMNYIYSGSTTDEANEAVWHGGNVPFEKYEEGKYTMSVGLKKPNELGLYDMSGNVEEWVSDCIGDYHKGTTFYMEESKFIVTDNCDVGIARGGGADGWIYRCTIQSRNDHPRVQRSPVLGFRLAHDLQ